MKYSEVFASYIDGAFRGSEVEQVINEFLRHIPSRVFHMQFDTSKSNKQGVKDGNKVYKLGLDLASATAFIEYFENFNQGQPTMAIYAEKMKSHITVSGWQANRRFLIRYVVVDGQVRKSVQTN